MSEQEGVIQFNLSHHSSDAKQYPELKELICWHQRIHALELIGQSPSRYDGYAYGNMSQRLSGNEFLISGTQTGGISHLTADHYAHIDHCDITNNHVQSHGPIKPSSECMSHAAVYTASPSAMAVIHIHNPDIWQQHHALQLSTTAADIEYGTPNMAKAVLHCIEHSPQCIAMLGHEDGIICFADDMNSAGEQILALHAQTQSLKE